MLGEAGAAALVDYDLLVRAISEHSLDKVARLLQVGLKPIDAPERYAVMETAQQRGTAEIYHLLKENIEQHGGTVAPYAGAAP